MAKDPRYMSFDHQYVETVTISDGNALDTGVEARRFVKRDGAYPQEGGYAAGVTTYRVYGAGELTDKGYQVNDGSTLVYEGQLNPATTPLKPGVFKYQKYLTVVTTGIVIVEVNDGSTFSVDDEVCADAEGKAIAQGGGYKILGRALDAITDTGSGQYIRVKLGNEAGA